ncbi:hypothetical protein OIK40_11050 [Erythrobacter sp. sf7]|uniref:Uncharacterized protein n=1 Tax=Erythrobacter fulvus TaxID=2987523 RepID=A0ABT5JRY9_9SPHN|nr:hypothetical protein [Erythrobacter fulvus]MDC8755175.1 hypothetical protein [Erythrobacter fulvus]
MIKVHLHFAACCGLLALAAPGIAAQKDASAESGTAQAASADGEERLDDALKRFGYLAGLARGCVVDEQQAALEREVLDLNGSITRLFGIDRAFLFSSAFGYGTSLEVSTDECVEVMKNYELRVARHRAAAGGVK